MAPDARGGRGGRGWDAYLAARALADAVRAPLTLAHKARKVLRDPGRHRPELDPARWFCRPRGHQAARRPAGGGRRPHVVFVGKGYGELRLIQRLDEALRARRADVATTWCGQVPEFFAGARAMAPDVPTVPLPFDVLPAVTWWMARVRPDVVVFVERVWNATLAVAAANAGARCVTVNAAGWQDPPDAGWAGRIQAWSRRRVAAALTSHGFQSEERARRTAPFLPPGARTQVTGNLKLDLPAGGGAAPVAAQVGRWLADRGDRPLLVAASTRKGDEGFVLEAYLAARRERPCALLLAPREMHRVEGVLELLRRAGLTTSRRTAPTPGADVFLLDTVGELSVAYPHGVAAFVGGTLRHQGQNFVEPLQHGVPVSFGPAEVLLMEEQRACVAAGLGRWVSTPDELAAHWREVLRVEDPPDRRAAAEAFLGAHRGALERTVGLLLAVLPPADAERAAGG